MGYNSTIVIYNDALSSIERNPNFGKELDRAIGEVACWNRPVDIPGGMVVETHHADGDAIVRIGGNRGEVLGYTYHAQDKLDVLKQLAREMGYRLVKKQT